MKLRDIASLFGRPLLLVGLRLGGAVAAFALNLILARAMSPDDMGTALSYMSMAILGAVVVSVSVEAGCVRFITRYVGSDDLSKARGMVQFSKRIVLTIGPLLFVCVAIALWAWSSRNGDSYPTTFLVMALISIVMAWLRVGETHSMAFGAVLRSILPTSLYRQVFLFAGVAGWVATYGSIDVTMVLVMMLVGLLLSILLQELANRKLYGAVGVGNVDQIAWREWIKVGLQLGLALLFVRYSRDIFLVVASASLPPADVAVLGIATALIGFAKFGVVAINQNITPELATAVSLEDHHAIRKVIRTSNHMKFWPMVAVFIGLALLGRPLLGLFGPAFEDATPILLILMIEPLALAFFGPGSHYISYSSRQNLMLPMSVFSVILYCFMITLGARIGGLEGAALGSSLAWVIWSGGLAWLTYRTSGFGIDLISSSRYSEK